MNRTSYDGLSKSHALVLRTIKNNPTMKLDELTKVCGIGKTRLSEIISDLKSTGRIERIGGNRNGYWNVKPTDS